MILSGVFLGPAYGFLAAGLGSGLADFLGGYLHYVPVTFLIKGLIALLGASIFRMITGTAGSGAAGIKHLAGVATGGVIDIILVAGGYWIYEMFLYGGAAALAVILYPVLHTCYQGLEREEREKAREIK